MRNNRRAQVESGVFQQLVVGIVLMSGMVLLAVQMMGNININYNGDIDTDQVALIGQYDEINETIGEFSNKILGRDDQQPESTNIIDLIVTAGYGTIKLMFNVPDILSNMIASGASSARIPVEGIWIMTTVVLVMVIFAAFAVIMKVRA